jgi:DNA-binding response OmpR family regulator
MAGRAIALLVDDDARLGALVKEYLAQNEVDVTVVGDGERGLRELDEHHFDVVMLDLMLPGIDGLEVCRRIRARPEWATLQIVGLELGADDYLAKPFNPRELLARLRAILRRAGAGGGAAMEKDRFRSGELEIRFGAREVLVGGKRQVLTHFEFELLSCLAHAAGRVLSREHLMDALKGAEFESFDRSIDVHVSKLRGKIEPDPKSPRYIKTVRGVGYVLARDGVEP